MYLVKPIGNLLVEYFARTLNQVFVVLSTLNLFMILMLFLTLHLIGCMIVHFPSMSIELQDNNHCIFEPSKWNAH